MQKTIFGDWGVGLNDGDYACALAALGVLESSDISVNQHSDLDLLESALEDEFSLGERTPIWRGARNINPDTTIDSWREGLPADAALLADAWRQYLAMIQHERVRPRLGVALDWRNRADLFDFQNLCSWLKHPDVGLDALVLADSREGHDVAWHWPLRIGVPSGSDPDMVLATLRTEQGKHHWIQKLSQCYAVGSGRDTCDVLILTTASTHEILAQSRTRLRTSFVVCLDDPPSQEADIADHYVELRERLQAVGLAVVGFHDQHSLGEWFKLVLAHLSHDLPIHAAVWDVGHTRITGDSVILGSPEALDRCRILAIAEQQDRVATLLVHAHYSDETLRSPSEDEPTFAPAPKAFDPVPGSLRNPFADELRARLFTSESVDGVNTANDLWWRENHIERARVPRWIKGDAWRPDASQSPAQSLAPGQWNLITLKIGPTEAPRFDAPFPDLEVDFTPGNVAVTVQLELHGAAIADMKEALLAVMSSAEMAGSQSQRRLSLLLLKRLPATQITKDDTAVVALASAEIILPQVGDSTLAAFAVSPHKGLAEVKGRVAIIHNNRILQTANVSIMVGAHDDSGHGLKLVAEAPIHPRDDDLKDRREYDVAIQVSDVGGKLHLTVQHQDTATQVQLDDLAQPLSLIRKALERAAVNWDFSKSVLEQDVFPVTLYALAANGSAFAQHLRKKCGDEIKLWERIHLVPATNEFLPLEYVYDGPPPRTNAKVCPNMLGALENASCDQAVKTPTGITSCANQNDNSFVCPMHFWGFRKLIERSGTVDLAPVPMSYGVQPEPVSVPSKQPYGKVRGMLFAASDRAFLYETDPQARLAERAALVKALSAISDAVFDAADWDKWRDAAIKQPNLLVLVVHAEQYQGAPALEIGDQKFLGYQEIQPDLSCSGGQPQLLILLGCSTAAVTENFQPYPELFRNAGVSIVVAPVATIRGADAVEIAKRMAQILSDRLARPDPTAFGDLLPLLRRELLREGHAGVMGVVGFGDGDWLLGGE